MITSEAGKMPAIRLAGWKPAIRLRYVMTWIVWTIGAILLLGGALAGFILIARRGRELRKSQPLPPPAAQAYLLWDENGKRIEKPVETPFYLGRDPECNIVIPGARAQWEACLFYHHSRFAFQTLPGADPILVNGEERPAGYLRDGETIRIAKVDFLFRCY